ncbi:MAG: flavodoxin domain-containing protein [Pseudomonadota bacterium]
MTAKVLHGSELGHTETIAEDVADALGGVEAKSLADVKPADLTGDHLYLLFCSSYGDGELPNTALDFAESLEGGARLDGVRFALFGLGDTSYTTFGDGPRTLRSLMLAAGAAEAAELIVHDVSTSQSAEDEAIAWAEKLAAANSQPAR